MEVQGLLDEVQAYLSALGTDEARAVASAIVVITAIVGSVAVPLLVRTLRHTFSDRVVRGPVETWVRRIRRSVPGTMPLAVFIRGLQLFVVLTTALALLVIWGQLNLATGLLFEVGKTMPNFAKVVVSLSIFAGTFVGTSLLGDQLRRFTNQTDRLTRHQEEIAYRILQITTFSVSGLVVLGLWNVNLSGLLVGAGFAGIILGMAARQTLGAALAGFVLMFARPFEIGDWVAIGDHEGIVTDISINNTSLENFDGEYIVISNDRVSDDVIINRTRKGRIRIRLEVGIDYETSLEHAEAVALEAVRDVDEVMTVPTPQIIPTQFADSAIILEVRYWVDKPSSRRRWRATAEVIRAIKSAYDREGIKIPYPQRELSGRTGGGFRMVEGPTSQSERTPPGT